MLQVISFRRCKHATRSNGDHHSRSHDSRYSQELHLLFCWPADQATSTHWICGWVHGRPRILRRPRLTASIGRVDCCRIWQRSSLRTGSPSFEAASRSRSSIRCSRTGIRLREILQTRQERLRRTSARLWLLKWSRKESRAETSGISFAERRRKSGRGRIFLRQVRPFRCLTQRERLIESESSGRPGRLYHSLQHADGRRCLITRHAVADGTPVDEMAEFYTSARTMMYDPTVSNAFRFSPPINRSTATAHLETRALRRETSWRRISASGTSRSHLVAGTIIRTFMLRITESTRRRGNSMPGWAT